VHPREVQADRSLESLLDLSTISIKEVIGRLKVIDDDEPQPLSGPITVGGKLHLTREQWEACQCDGKKGESPPSTGGRKRGKRHKSRGGAQAGAQGHAEGSVRGGAPGGAAGNQKSTRDDVCHNYGKLGHWVKECRLPRRGQAHVTQVEEEEPSLLLANASIELSPAASAAAALLHLDEPRAHALLGDGSNNDKTDGWCLDTGVTHHMTGRREFFTKLEALDLKRRGRVTIIGAIEKHRTSKLWDEG
jgi:hypothetical protein